jgi:spore coat polysaccharide biosynthesis predicted glycosyltransferase SpsG
VLHSALTGADLAQLAGELRLEHAVVVADSYRLDGDDLSNLRERVRLLVAVDDMADRRLDVDLVLNQNADALDLSMSLGVGTKVLVGSAYALLRPEFARLRALGISSLPDLPELPRRVLVLMGGTDPTGSAPVAAAAAGLAFPEAEIEVVVPSLTQPRRRGAVTEMPRIVDVAAHMLRADLVVTAAGSTLWELFCLARPVAAVQVADNQARGYDRLLAAGTIIGLGRPPIDVNHAAERLRDGVTRHDGLRVLGESGSTLVDGRGAERVLDAIEQMEGESA